MLSLRKIVKKNIVFILIFTILSCITYWKIFFGNVFINGQLLVSFYGPYKENLPFKNNGWDQLRIYFPYYKFTFDEFKKFRIPLWNPYAFAGHPHAADFQSAVFYPLNIFGLFLSQITFWHILVTTAPILGSFFTFLYLRSLNLSKISSVFGAISFGFSPLLLTWSNEVIMSPHSIIWLPLILYSIENYLRVKSKKYLILLIISSIFTFLAGYMQTTIYLFIFVIAYLIFKYLINVTKKVSPYIRIILALLLGTSIAAIQLVPSAELFLNSARSNIPLTKILYDFLIPPEGLLTFFTPDYFGNPATYNFFRRGSAQYYESIMFIGIGLLLFALFAIFVTRNNYLKFGYRFSKNFIFFLLIIFLVSLSTTLDLPTSKLFLSLPIPFLSTSIANRVLFIPAFCLSIVGAVGMDAWLRIRNSSINRLIYLLGCVYLILISYALMAKTFGFPYYGVSKFSLNQSATISLRNLIIPTGVFTVISLLIMFGIKISKKVYIASLIILISFLHNFLIGQKYFSYSDKKYVFPNVPVLNFIRNESGLYRSWSTGDKVFENNFATQYKIFWPEGYDSLNNRRYAEFTYAMQGNDVTSFNFRADAGLGRGNLNEIIVNPLRRKLMNILGVKYVMAHSKFIEIMEQNSFKRIVRPELSITSEDDYAIFENLSVLPRAFLASDYQIESDKQSILNKMRSMDFDFSKSVLLEEFPRVSPEPGSGWADIVSYTPKEVSIKTNSKSPKILFLSDNYYPGWRAKIDGHDAKILRADYTFRAVAVDSGEHLVKFYLDSGSFKVGVFISILGIIISSCLLIRKNSIIS